MVIKNYNLQKNFLMMIQKCNLQKNKWILNVIFGKIEQR